MIIKDNPSIQKKESVVLKEILDNIYSHNLLFKLEPKPIVLTDFDKAPVLEINKSYI
jgi:hypothetical protein